MLQEEILHPDIKHKQEKGKTCRLQHELRKECKTFIPLSKTLKKLEFHNPSKHKENEI